MKKILLLCLIVVISSYVVADKKKRPIALNYVPGQIIVKLKQPLNKAIIEVFIQKSMSIKSSLSTLAGDFVVLNIENDQEIYSEISELNKLDAVAYAEPNYIYHAIGQRSPSSLTNDPKFSKLWGLVNNGNNEPASSRGNSSPSGVAGADINAKDAWGLTKGDRRIKIAIIDTGIDYNHKDLKNNIWTNSAELNGVAGVDDDGNGYIDDIHGYDFANKDGDPMDGNGHGTHCAGTVAAEHDNAIGVAGVMAHAQLVAVKFLSDQGSGSTEDAIAAIDYATKVGVDIMSNSWGGGGHSQALKDAIEAANRAGIIFTAAAGNSATDNNVRPHYPSNYQVDNVISVAAHNYNDGLASFSCYGSNTVHVAAPGRNILSTVPNNMYDVYSGTSMATPHVTGVIGLYLSHLGKTSPKVVRDKLMSSSVYARAYGRKTIGGGRVDAYNFLTGVETPRPAKPNPQDWVNYPVATLETAHPYLGAQQLTHSFTVPGARFVRVVIERFDIEKYYDYLAVTDQQGVVIEKLDGQGQNHYSEYVEGDTIGVYFESDVSVEKWGFVIKELQYVP